MTLIFVAGIYAVMFAVFVDEYFVHFSYNRAEHWGIAQKKLAEYLI